MKIVKKKEEICFPEEGCVKSFQQYSSLEKHLDCRKHQYAFSTGNTKLERGAGVLPEIVDVGASISVEDYGFMLQMGWALK